MMVAFVDPSEVVAYAYLMLILARFDVSPVLVRFDLALELVYPRLFPCFGLVLAGPFSLVLSFRLVGLPSLAL